MGTAIKHAPPRSKVPATTTGAGVMVYGIPNCDQVKKAREWLDARPVQYTFHDFKKQGLSVELARTWIETAGAARVINRKGTTWRALDEARKALADKAFGAVALASEHPSLVKRPVLTRQGALLIGFDADAYANAFK